MVFGTEFRDFPLVWSLYSPTTRTCIGTSTGGTAWKFAPTPPPERSGELCILKNGFPYPAFRFRTRFGVLHTRYEKKQTSFEREKIYIFGTKLRDSPLAWLLTGSEVPLHAHRPVAQLEMSLQPLHRNARKSYAC